MSHKNRHMGLKPTGIRGGIAKFTTSKTMPKIKLQELYENLSEQMTDINTWEDFNNGCVAEDLYGNTKYTDLKIIPHFFNAGLNMTKASAAIGYALRNDANRDNQQLTGIMLRLRRMNIRNLFAIIQVFIDKSLIDIHTIHEILRIDGHFTQKHAAIRRGKFYKYYAKWYVVDAVKYTKENLEEENVFITHDDVMTMLETHLGVNTATLQYWLDLEVEDIMVKPS